jgi:hypothetical protein
MTPSSELEDVAAWRSLQLLEPMVSRAGTRTRLRSRAKRRCSAHGIDVLVVGRGPGL